MVRGVDAATASSCSVVTFPHCFAAALGDACVTKGAERCHVRYSCVVQRAADGHTGARKGHNLESPPMAVDPDQSFPELEERVLERWRERDVFERVAAQPRGRASSGCSTRGRRPRTGGPGAHHVLARVFKDIYPRFKTMRGLLRRAQGRLGLPRAAGRDRGRAAARHQHEGRDRGVTASPSSTSAAASRCSSTSRTGTR